MNKPRPAGSRAQFCSRAVASAVLGWCAASVLETLIEPGSTDAGATLISSVAESKRIAVGDVGRVPETWWASYVTRNPGIQRFPGSYLRAIFRHAESGDEASLVYLKEQGFYAEVQELLRDDETKGSG